MNSLSRDGNNDKSPKIKKLNVITVQTDKEQNVCKNWMLH